MILSSFFLTLHLLFLPTVPGCTPNPNLVEKIHRIVHTLEQKGWKPHVTEICRSVEDQRQKVEQGYSQTMFSKHVVGRAFDLIDSRYWWNIPDSHQFWKDFGKACEKEGLVWGGRWKGFPDVAHCEMKPGDK